MRVRSRVTLLVVGLLLVSSSLRAVPVFQWNKQFAVSTRLPDSTPVAIDGSGNVILAGISNGSVNFGGGFLSGGTFVAKFDASGNHIWSKTFFGGPEVQSVAVDGLGNIAITGALGSVDFGGGLLSSDNGDIYVAVFGPDGTHRWSKQFGDTHPQQGHSVAMDGSGNVVITGEMYGSVNFGGATLTAGVFSPDVFVAKFDTNGNHIWSKRFGDTDKQIGWSVAADASGNSIVTGQYAGSFSFGGALLPQTNFPNVFVAKFGPDGSHIWSRGAGYNGSSQGYSIAADGSGNAVILGTGGVDFGGGLVSGLFLAKLDANGNHVWSKGFSTSFDPTFPPTCAVNAAGMVAIAGQIGSNTDFGGGQLHAGGNGNAYVAVFDPDGDHSWSQSFGDTLTLDAGRSVAVDSFGNIVLTGLFNTSIDFGGGTLTNTFPHRDIFLVKFMHGTPLPVLITSFKASPRQCR